MQQTVAAAPLPHPRRQIGIECIMASLCCLIPTISEQMDNATLIGHNLFYGTSTEVAAFIIDNFQLTINLVRSRKI